MTPPLSLPPSSPPLLHVQVASTRGPDALRQDLLVGFDPLSPLLAALEARYGHLATFCVDGHGGQAVAVRWRPATFVPTNAAARAETYHTSIPCMLAANALAAAGGKGGSGKGGAAVPTVVVPNVAMVLAEMREIGEGLVGDVVVAPRSSAGLLRAS